MGQKDMFRLEHRLLADPTPSAPNNWWDQLKATAGVQATGFLDSKDGVCHVVVYGTPPPGVPVRMDAKSNNIYSLITFTQPLTTYDAALYTISNVGLRLADPCYEQAQLQKKEALSWHPMGQEGPFTTHHSLVVAISAGVTSSLWHEQLSALRGVGSIEFPFKVKC